MWSFFQAQVTLRKHQVGRMVWDPSDLHDLSSDLVVAFLVNGERRILAWMPGANVDEHHVIISLSDDLGLSKAR